MAAEQIDVRVTVHEYIGTEWEKDEGEAVLTDDFYLTAEERQNLLEAVEHTLSASTFFINDDNIEFVDSRRFSLTISHIRSHV